MKTNVRRRGFAAGFGKCRLLLASLSMLLLVGGILVAAPSPGGRAFADDSDQDMRGVWVSTVYNLDYPSRATTSAATLRSEADAILDNVVKWGGNAVFLQVRPCADALYDSDLFPWSVYLTGSQTSAPSDGFDPLAYWVQAAHQRGIELHAWINPYRITKSAADWNKLAADSPAKLHPEWVIKHDGNYYFDPALPEVRQLVIDGAVEIIRSYDVDGIHLDDYFYPGTDFADSASYATYGAGYSNIGDWRRHNVDLLVQGLEAAIDRVDDDVEFGISPAGIWASKTLNPAGSNTTSTFSSYYQHYADTKKWAEQEWVDYLAPQIYWERGHSTADFTALLDWWSGVARSTDTDLYIGLAAYRSAEATSSSSVWYGATELASQLAAIEQNPEVEGVIYFRYGSIESTKALQDMMVNIYQRGSSALSQAGIRVFVEGEQVIFDQQPRIENNRVLVPMRAIFEALDAEVDWNAASSRITAYKDDTTVRLTLGSRTMSVNGVNKTLDVAAKAVGGRTLIPLRAVSEALDCDVHWNSADQTVTITD